MRHDTLIRRRIGAAVCGLALSAQLAVGQNPSSPTTGAATRVEFDKAVEREISSGQSHEYVVDVPAGAYFHADVEQKGIDVAVSVFDPTGARLTEVVFGCLYALALLGWAWAVVPISREAALATALVLLVTPTYAGLFHDVSSDPVFAFILAWWAGAVVRAWKTGATSWLAAVGGGVALLTLCRPASQVAVLACVLVPLVAFLLWSRVWRLGRPRWKREATAH